MGRKQIFNREPERFEDSYLTIILPGWKFAEFSRNVSRRPSPFGDPHHDIARFLKGGGA